MAQAQEDLETGALYQRYVQALKRYGDPMDKQPSPGHVIRHCTNCGMRAMFRMDPDGMWYECLHCGHYA
jgi:DNA-directed RNA polymerase subunit RPC12/RpoP